MCECVAGQCGALWPADGGRTSLWPGPAGLLPGLWVRLQPGSAQPAHTGKIPVECHHMYSKNPVEKAQSV